MLSLESSSSEDSISLGSPADMRRVHSYSYRALYLDILLHSILIAYPEKETGTEIYTQKPSDDPEGVALKLVKLLLDRSV